jgi:membrane fusion protein (multidrug efflux system)
MHDGNHLGPGNKLTEEAPDVRAPTRTPALQGEQHATSMDLPPLSRRTVTIIAGIMTLLFIAMFFIGWAPHTRKIAAAATAASEASDAKAVVDVIMPKASGLEDQLMLPADVRPNQMTAIFARTSGYLKPLPPGIDIGAHVDAGQVIAEIASPEVDAQLDQAMASLEQARVAALRAQSIHVHAIRIRRARPRDIGAGSG